MMEELHKQNKRLWTGQRDTLCQDRGLELLKAMIISKWENRENVFMKERQGEPSIRNGLISVKILEWCLAQWYLINWWWKSIHSSKYLLLCSKHWEYSLHSNTGKEKTQIYNIMQMVMNVREDINAVSTKRGYFILSVQGQPHWKG